MNNIDLEKRIIDLENDIESFLFMFLSNRVERKCSLELLEDAIIKHFNVKKTDFKSISFKSKGSVSRKISNENKDIVEARKWMIVLSRFVLMKTTGSLSMEYHWYSIRNEHNYRKILKSALDPKDANDQKERETFLSICSTIKRDAKELYESNRLDLLVS